ncbi:histidine triad nucleotide-binding protein [Clostridium algidicarnis]|uniref:Histidine triad (HIT) family protein n=2 Tax=Clostridium algidicarnis TaxID=37659 RepID=A0A2S6G0U8_9CLOT|nr:histidine triad nucleotide-binding protein [Clostridium algidicarnis]MBB6630500.1 histidine triad nucleotide-binding protein [Clostridium algidicarnis]MBU3193582.1 histidine triad nucleotide-binding protein [Clostridium algidicarnis]MBU3203012.1 histidine triad nucleotide-binding protein [Clostridium algidicarnis]MBU3205689.1 histidine triad nucleotide-binding protein [Clostridium algidicarnis]MBU3211166.1 histidine triad nucleotide-binding protein [Clostridium algidicarnis]
MESCIFCKIINGDIPSEKVYEDDKVYAFKDLNPEAPIHILIIPKTHITNTNEINEENASVISSLFISVAKIAKMLNVDESGYRVVNNCGKQGGQTVEHLHFHMLGGRDLTWPPG